MFNGRYSAEQAQAMLKIHRSQHPRSRALAVYRIKDGYQRSYSRALVCIACDEVAASYDRDWKTPKRTYDALREHRCRGLLELERAAGIAKLDT